MAALTELTRTIAIAFQDRGLREAIGREMHSSGATRERKLELSRFARSAAGTLLIEAGSRSAGITADSLHRLVDALPSLEFYMPVRAHRAAWAGEDVYVVSQLEKTDPLIAFDERGEAVAVDPKTPPTVPTFVLVASETNFGAASGRGALRDETCDPNMAIIPCEPDNGAGPTGIPTYAPSGLYMTYLTMDDLSEYWWEGDPEVEIHVMGPGAGDPAWRIRDLYCAGETASGWSYFDQYTNTWSGIVLVIPATELEANGYNGTDGGQKALNVAVYEDDSQACVIHDHSGDLPNQLKGIWNTYLSTVILGGLACATYPEDPQHPSPPGERITCWSAWVQVGIGAAVIDLVVDLLKPSDDFLGVAINSGSAGYTNPNASHAVMRANSIRGGIKLEYHTYGH